MYNWRMRKFHCPCEDLWLSCIQNLPTVHSEKIIHFLFLLFIIATIKLFYPIWIESLRGWWKFLHIFHLSKLGQMFKKYFPASNLHIARRISFSNSSLEAFQNDLNWKQNILFSLYVIFFQSEHRCHFTQIFSWESFKAKGP